jgi:hypothetical protein
MLRRAYLQRVRPVARSALAAFALQLLALTATNLGQLNFRHQDSGNPKLPELYYYYYRYSRDY